MPHSTWKVEASLGFIKSHLKKPKLWVGGLLTYECLAMTTSEAENTTLLKQVLEMSTLRVSMCQIKFVEWLKSNCFNSADFLKCHLLPSPVS